MLLVLTALQGAPSARGIHPTIQPLSGAHLKRFIIPAYPPLARLAGVTGVVAVGVQLDELCNNQDTFELEGPGELQMAIRRAFRNDSQSDFTGCAGQARQGWLHFKFSLEGEPSNEWAPTHVRQLPGNTIEISTRPPDLKSLGLMRVPAPGPDR